MERKYGINREKLDAIECIHSSQNREYASWLMGLSKQYNLFKTGGSDFHGRMEDGVELGMGKDRMKIPYEFVKEFSLLQYKGIEK